MTEHGYCQCGCGQLTPLATKTRTERGWVKGEPIHYLRGHGQAARKLREPPPPPNPSGYCQCGCGQLAPIASMNQHALGYRKGSPVRFVRGHQGRMPWSWVEEDRGYESPCWIWEGGKDPNGYGRCGHGYAHRRAYEMAYGSIPKGHHIHHRCEQTSCINPAHLEAIVPARHRDRHPNACPPGCSCDRHTPRPRERCTNGHLYAEVGRRTSGKIRCPVCYAAYLDREAAKARERRRLAAGS